MDFKNKFKVSTHQQMMM